jgi:hypothetical protein
LGQKNEALGRKIPSRDTTQKVPKSSKFGPTKRQFRKQNFQVATFAQRKEISPKSKEKKL